MANPLLTDEQNRKLANQNSTYNQIMQGFEPVQQQQDDSWLDGLSRGAKAGFGGFGAGLLHAGQAAFGTDGSLAAGLDAMAKNNAQRREWNLADTLSLDYLTNPEGLAYGIGQIAGSMALPALFGAGVAAAVPTGGTSLLGTGALIGAAGAAPMAISEGGNTYAQGLQQGMTEDEAKKAGLTDAAIKLPFYMLSEGLSGKVAQGLISKGLLNAEGKSLGRRAAESGAKILGNAANEAYEEGTENRSSAYALGDQRISSLGNIFNPFDWNEEDKAQAVGVFTPTLALGALTGGAGHLRSRFDKKSSDVAEEIASEDGGTIEEAPTEENFWENKEVAKHSIQQAYADGLISKDDARVMLMELNGEELGEADKKRLKAREKQVAAAIESRRIQGYNDELDNYVNNRESGKEAFINAIAGQESGGDYGAVNGDTGAYGKYQIIPSNWPAWAEEAGIGADAPRTPENQEIVARFKLGQYYDKYGARGAAIAWYGGEGALNYSDEALNRKQGDNGEYPSINEYADEVLGRMGNVADSVRIDDTIDDTEENYFDESNYTDDAILGSLNPVRGFDVSHLDKGTAQDRNSLLYGERVKKAKPAPASEEVASFNQSLDNSNAQKAPNSLFVNSPRSSWDAAERIYKARAKEQAERKARAQAIVNIANTQQQSFLNVLRNRAAQQWDNAEQAYKDRKQDKLQSLANVINARAAQKWDAKEVDNAQKARAEQEKQAQLQNIARLLDARAAQQWDNAERDANLKQNQAQALANLLNAKAAGQYDVAQQVYANRAKEQAEKQRQQQAIANIINARAAQKFDEAETADKFKFVPQRQSMYDGAMRRNLAAQDKVKPEEQPSVEPTGRNGAALDKRNMLDVTLPKVREQHKWNKEHKEYHAERYGESALPQTQLLSTDRAARRNMPKPGIEARSFINDRAEKKSARERMQDAIAFVWGDDPKHPLKACRRQLNMFRDMRKEYLQPIYDVMAEGAGNGVSRIPIIEFDNQHRGRFYRQSNNSPWYAKYFKEHKKKPTQKAMYDIAEEVAFGENADIGYYAGVQGKELEAIVAENHAQLDPINDYIQTYESLELRLKENPNYGKEQAERINKAEEARRAEKRNAGETASAESIQTEAKQPAESNQDEVNKKAVSKDTNGIDKAKVHEVLEAISDKDVFDSLAETTNIDKTLVGKSKEELYKIAVDNIKDKQGKVFKDPLGNKIYFAPGNTETLEGYALHLIAGMGKPIEDIRVQRVLGVLLSDKTIQKPWAIVRQDNGRKMYLSVYRGENSMTNGLIIGVEEGQDGRVVTSMLTANKKGDKKAALREFKKHVSGADEVLYIWEGLTGHSRPSSDQQASTANASLDLSGSQSISQPAENVKKLNLPKGTTVDVSIVGDNSNIIQVKFNGAQGKGTGGIMGRAGYKWKSDKQVWQARKTEKALDVAEQLGYKPTEEMSEDKSQQIDKYKNYSKEDIKINKERLATMPDVDGILQPAAKKFAEFFKAHFPKSDYTYETVDFWNNYILEFEQLNKILKKYRQATQQGDLSAADAYFQQISSSLDRLNNLLGKLVGKDKEEQQAQMRQEFRDSIIPFFDEYHKIVDEHNAKDHAKKTSKAKKQQGKQEYKYYLNARPADIGAVPKGFIRVDAEDKGGRYGAIYYDRQLNDTDVQQYELKSADDVEKEKAQKEALETVSKELLKSDKLKAQAKNNSIGDFVLAYRDAVDDYLAEHVDENPAYTKLLNNPEIADEFLESESIIEKAYDKLKASDNSQDVVQSNKGNTNEGGNNNGIDITGKLSSNDTGSRRAENEIRTTSSSEESSGSNGQGSRTLEGQSGRNGNNGVPGSRTAVGGKTSISKGSEQVSAVRENPARSAELSGSVVDSLQEQPNVDEGSTDKIVESVADGRTDAADTVNQKVNEVVKENNLDRQRADRLRKTAKVMPFLSKIQFSNTDFVADRLADNGKQGVMITDGTGTGKTFSGLAVAKEMVEDGKENILIVTPSDSVNNQWANAAKDFFGIELSKLDNIQDAGKGAVITTYANLGANDALIKRDWDLVICDESHYLMNNEQGEKTAALAKLRQLTLHPRELRARAEERILPEEKLEARRTIAQAAKLKRKKGQLKASEEAIVEKAEKLQKEKADELSKEERVQVEAQVKDWEQLNTTEKPKVMFMSATPFAYVPDIDYAEGYLFDYPKVEGGSYNQPGNGFQQFMIEHFGYHMRYNKLTKPDKAVDNAVMEVEFHEWLRKTGALTGHELEIDKDYNRGFLLVDQGVGKKIDEGFDFLRNNHDKYRELEGVLNKQFDSRRRNYLLESIKARESVPIIQQYLKAGKKVVVFYETNVERESFNPFKFTQQTKELLQSGENRWTSEEIQHEMDMFAKERPDLVNLNLDELSEPISIYREAFGDDAMFFNGRVSKNKRAEYVKAFNDDNSDKNLIFVQQDAGNAGISLHDTTGKHQRVLINIGIPRRPSYAIQIEGRIYRLGNKSNAIIRYLTTATNIENGLFAETVAGRASTAENLALGRRARGLRDSFKNAYQEIFDGTWEDRSPGTEGEDVGGKENDRNIVSTDSDYDRAKAFYFARGKKTAKNKAAEGVDYFATPEPVGYKMVQWAGLKDGDRVLEPSAGHGAISRFFSPNTDNTIIEPSSRLAPQAQMNTDNAKLINGYFEDLHIGNKYDAVTMNPPFGTGGKTAVEHVAKAFKHLRNGGRVIAIIPRGAMADKRFDAWYESDDAKDAHMVGEVLLPGVTFERAGTKVATRIVIIDKGGESQGVKRIDLSRINNINELFDNLESVEMPARQTKQSNAGTANFANSLRKGDAEGKSEVVTADSYKHTKTGEIIPSAKLNANLSDEEYRKVKSIADKNGGYYSRYAKAFLFQDNESGRDKFVEEVNGANNTQYSVSSEAVQRVKKEIDEEIRKALPGAKMLPMSGDAYLVELPNGKTIFVKIAEEIIHKGKTREKALKDHNLSDDKDLVVGGFWQKWENLDGKSIDGILAVSIEGSKGTAFHESLHAAMDLCLNEKEKAALYKYYAKKAKESGRVIDEEIADGYKEWALKRQRGQGSMFGKLFQKVTDFLNKLYTMFAKANNKGNIFRKLESGEAWKQQGEKSSQGAQYAVTNNAITGETLVPIVDVSGLSKADISTTALQSNIARGLIGKTFRIIGSNGIGKVANVKEGKHLLNSSKVRARNETARLKTLTAIDDVLNNAVYVEKHSDERHGSNDKYIELYAVVKNNDNLFRFRIVAKEGDKKAGDYEVKIAKFYDIIKDGKVTANAQSALPAIIPDGMKGQVRGTLPSTISVAKLLAGVKGRDGKLLVNKNGGLNYNSEIFKGIKEPADYSIKYSVASPKHKIANAFTNTERKGVVDSAKDFFKEQKKNWYTDLIDKNHILKSFDQLTKTGLSVYDQVQNLPSTTAGMLKAICEGNALSIKAANQHLKNVKMKYNITLAMALAQIDKKTMDKAQPKYLATNGFDSWVNAFGAYLGAERLLEMNDLAKADGKVYKFPKGLTEAELRAFTRNAPEQFRKAADMFYKVNDNMISVMEDAQVFSHDLAQQLRTKYKKYCPLLRDFSDTAAADTFINGLTEGGRGIGNVSVPLKKINIEGSERGVLNPLESVLKSYSVMLNRAERNKVGLMAVNAAKTAQLHDLIKEVPEVKGKDGKVVNAVADPKNCIFTVLVNGKKKAYQTTQELYSPIVGYNLPAAGLCINVARMAAHMLRTGATMSPSFIVRNFLRDTIFASISSKNGFVPFVDSIRGALALWNDPAMRAEFEAAGVTEFNFYGSQNARIKSIDAMAGENPVGMWQMAKWLFTHMEAASDFVESSTRMGEFMKAKEKGLSMEEAARAAREVTLDFSRSGVVGEQINRYVPFFNACLQGGDKMVRLFREDFVGTSLKVFKYIVLPSLLIMAMNWDEDWYKDLDPDIKNNYWCLGRNIRIPKPQEAGVLFGSGIEALVQQAADKDKEAVENWLKAFSSNIIPGIVPTLFLPILEWQANYSYFKGRQLVGSKYQRLPDELQYNDYTSELSKGIGSVLKVSPMKVDNLVRGYTGTMGSLLWNAAGEPFAKANNLPAKHFNEILFVRDFNVTDANLSRPMNEFYGILDKANRQHAGYGVKGKPEAAVKGIRSAGAMISKIRKDIDKITHSNLTPERKRELIDKRKEKMNQIAKQANARYGKYFD